MKFLPLVTSGSIISPHNFWNAVFLYQDRPQIINRKIVGASELSIFKVDFNSSSVKIKDLLTHSGLLYEVRKLTEFNSTIAHDLIKSILQPYDKNVIISQVEAEFFKVTSEGLYISARRLLPKLNNNFCIELILFDKNSNIASFVAAEDSKAISAPPFPYHLEVMSTGHARLLVDNIDDADTPSAEWLVDKLFMKLIKWCENYSTELITDPSLKLIDLEQYCKLYKDLKEKYGRNMVKIWPENTDPLKFVYEDVAIAAYLICLWEQYSPGTKPTFVDLGCGNGLLVYILSEEGYTGYGIDVRRRKIWDLYPKHVRLEEKTIIPSGQHLFPDTDWIIGNHSDELTPWIPVIAARSSYKTNFFLLPCCSYEFSGKKYNRKDTSKSQYCEYLEYVDEICKKCGFLTEIDKLRIPSTKKTCIVSVGHLYKSEEFDRINMSITEMISKQTGAKNDCKSENWANNFEPRGQVEKVRNCTQIGRDLIKKFVDKVVVELLKSEEFVPKYDGSKWIKGGSVLLPSLVQALDPEDLKQLKNECGGLQTLLRNHRYIFEVSKGAVKLRIPPKLEAIQKYKDKPCWFNLNHPNGCLHTSGVCAYSHLN